MRCDRYIDKIYQVSSYLCRRDGYGLEDASLCIGIREEGLGWVGGFEPSTAGATVRSLPLNYTHRGGDKIITFGNVRNCGAEPAWSAPNARANACLERSSLFRSRRRSSCNNCSARNLRPDKAALLLLTANVDSCFSSLSVWHWGHSASAPQTGSPRTCVHRLRNGIQKSA